MKKIAILTSGGDASSMNKVLSTFVKYAISKKIKSIKSHLGQILLDFHHQILSHQDLHQIHRMNIFEDDETSLGHNHRLDYGFLELDKISFCSE